MQGNVTLNLQTEAREQSKPAPSKPAVIINASSGADDKSGVRVQLEKVFAAVNARISFAQSGAEIIELARRAVEDNCQPIIAGGGDGTINAVASVVVDTDRTLGVLPLGTLNHFAKDLKIPLDIESAVRVCLAGQEMKIDVGEVNGRIFLNNSSLGLYPNVVRHREKQQHLGRGKWPAFVWAALTMLKRYPFLNVRLSTAEQSLTRRTPFVFIGNNEYEMESLQIGARSCIDKGQLSLYVAHRTGRLGLLRLALRALFGHLHNAHDFDAVCTKEVSIETRRPKRLRVATDGEVTVMTTPLQYRVRPGALRVLVPKGSDE